MIGPGIHIKGDIAACDSLVVEGTVESTLEARCLQIRPGGQFIGEAKVETAEIQGRFEGRLKVTGNLVVGPRARLKGATRYASLEVEKGGQISGEIDARPVELSVATTNRK